jgi:hypothetical protein
MTTAFPWEAARRRGWKCPLLHPGDRRNVWAAVHPVPGLRTILEDRQ